jgi:hypothetical protein
VWEPHQVTTPSHLTKAVHAGPTVCLGGTHMRDQHGFMRYSYGTHIRWDPHQVGPTHFRFVGTHNSVE